jgi:hypothetical protein
VTRHPYGPDELDRHDPELDRVAHELEAFGSEQDRSMPPGLVARIQMAIDAEPDPSRGWWVALLSTAGGWQRTGRMVAVAAVVAVAVVGALALGQILDVVRSDVGTSPQPSPSALPSDSPSPSPSPSPTATPSASPSPSPTVAPTASDDDGVGTPEPSDDDTSGPGGGGDDDETPEPDETDHSGPGGGGGDD